MNTNNCWKKRSFQTKRHKFNVNFETNNPTELLSRKPSVLAPYGRMYSPYSVKIHCPLVMSNRMRPGIEEPSTPREATYMNWPTVLSAVSHRQNLTQEQAAWAMQEMMSGIATDAQIAGFLMALSTKGETVDELLGLAEAMLEEAVSVDLPSDVLDIVGTGGDRLGTVNLSTMSSLVAVGAGAKIVKHGNRGSSSTAGAADVIEALGVDLNLTQSRAKRSLEEAGITFLFAQ